MIDSAGSARLKRSLDRSHPIGHACRFDRNDLKAEFTIDLFVDPFKTQSLLKADPPRFGRRNEAKIPYKENTLLKDRLRVMRSSSLESVSGTGCPDTPPAQQCRRRSDHGTVPVQVARRAKLPPPLQISDRIDERGMRPWFSDTLRLCESNHVSRRLLDDAESIKLQ